MQLEKRDEADKSTAERGAKLREAIRTADDPERIWPVNDLADAIGLMAVTKKRLLDHFVETGKERISLRELMDMCLDARSGQSRAIRVMDRREKEIAAVARWALRWCLKMHEKC